MAVASLFSAVAGIFESAVLVGVVLLTGRSMQPGEKSSLGDIVDLPDAVALDDERVTTESGAHLDDR